MSQFGLWKEYSKTFVNGSATSVLWQLLKIETSGFYRGNGEVCQSNDIWLFLNLQTSISSSITHDVYVC